MARLSSEVRLAWDALSAQDQEAGWRSIPLEPAGPILIYAGRQAPSNDEAILFAFDPKIAESKERLPSGHGFIVSRIEPLGESKFCIALSRRNNDSIELFSLMACDVAAAMDSSALTTSDQSKLFRSFLGRVRAWQEFMRKGAGPLSSEREVGLVGELMMLNSIIVGGISANSVVTGWVGPLDAPQDFLLGVGAIEVKATLAGVGFPARIGSLEQLDDAHIQPIFVAGVRLTQGHSGDTLPELVARIRVGFSDDAEATRVFRDRLFKAGYLDLHAEEYIRRFLLVEIRVVEVKLGFPRLTRGSVPLGVTNASYEIDLDVSGAGLALQDVLKTIGVR